MAKHNRTKYAKKHGGATAPGKKPPSQQTQPATVSQPPAPAPPKSVRITGEVVTLKMPYAHPDSNPNSKDYRATFGEHPGVIVRRARVNGHNMSLVAMTTSQNHNNTFGPTVMFNKGTGDLVNGSLGFFGKDSYMKMIDWRWVHDNELMNPIGILNNAALQRAKAALSSPEAHNSIKEAAKQLKEIKKDGYLSFVMKHRPTMVQIAQDAEMGRDPQPSYKYASRIWKGPINIQFFAKPKKSDSNKKSAGHSTS